MKSFLRLMIACSFVGALLVTGCGGPVGLGDAGAPRDAASTEDASPSLSLSGLPDDTWSFVEVPGAVCGNGSPASIGVNPHAGATDVLIVIAGGGACWDDDTCFVRNAAVHVHEDYTRAMFDEERAIITAASWDDRAAALNPFRQSHIVYVPYCTGDLHSGDSVESYSADPTHVVHHQGAVNMQRYVDAMTAAWPALTTVRTVGFSAGGYGTQLNWGRFQDGWPDASLVMLADCSPMADPEPTLYATWRDRWNMATPAGCTDCATTFTAYDEYFDRTYPSSRFGLLATTRDAVITQFWGVTDFTPHLDTLLTDHLDDNATTRYFVVDSDVHVILGQAGTLRSADGTLLFDWLLGWLENDSRWHNTRP